MIVQVIAPGILAGAERVVLGGAAALRDAGFESRIAVISETRAPEHAGAFIEAADELGVPTVRLISRGRLDPHLIWSLRRELARDCRVVHAHGFKGAFVAASARPRRLPLVATHHGEWPTDGGRVRLYRRAVAWAYRRSDALVSVAEATRERLSAQGLAPHKITTIENFLHLPSAPSRSAAKSARDPDAPLALLFLGRLSREKGCDLLLRAMARSSVETTLRIVGSGPEEERLIHLAAALELANRVRFVGQVNDVRPHIEAADVLVMPSRTEALPMALIEALSLGTPAVGTAVGGVPDVIEDGVTGYVVAPEQVDTLARALERAAEHYDKLAAGVAAAEDSLRARFSAARWADETLALYRRLGATLP